VFNSIQLFGFVLLGGLAFGELSRRVFALPRTTGFVVFGLIVGQSGFGWIDPIHIESAQLFIDLALGLILFELGYQVPTLPAQAQWQRVRAGITMSLLTSLLIVLALSLFGFSFVSALFAATLCIATSPAITIATCSDVGAKGEKTDLLFTLVAINGAIAFIGVAWSMPFLTDSAGVPILGSAWEVMKTLLGSLLLGGACAGIVLLGATKLGRHPEHQHLLVLGTIVLGVGTAIFLDISVLFPMLVFGVLTRMLDHRKQVVAIRIASDARIFLVITFVLAGAALDIGMLQKYWLEALAIVVARFLGQFSGLFVNRRQLDLSHRSMFHLAVGLQPMSGVALVLLVNTQALYRDINPDLTGSLLATILLMQLLGPLATQTAIQGFGEATRLNVPPVGSLANK
jgi:Kef-type K+ transport system membrane component KefB